MASIPKKVSERLSKEVQRFQKVLQAAKNRDVNESDTVTIITDMLDGVFGYDKYTEITSEQAIRGTYCDLAVKLDNQVKYLIEVKAIGLSLKEAHLRQAVNYAANLGIFWVVLTNGVDWEIYKIRFERPISHDLVCSFNFLELNGRKQDDQSQIFLLCREGLSKDAISEFHQRVKIVNRFVIGALLQSDSVIDVLRRELRRIDPGVKAEKEELRPILEAVLKRDVIEGESSSKAKSLIKRASSRTLRKCKPKKAGAMSPSDSGSPDTAAKTEDATSS